MPLSRITIIDCGASCVALGVFSLSNGRLRCEHLATESLNPRASTGDTWLADACAALQALAGQAGASGPATLILPPHLLLLKHLPAPRVAAAQRAKIVRFEIAQNIPFPVAEVAWDTTVSGERGAEVDLLLAAAKLAHLEPLAAAAAASGLVVQHMLPAPLALVAAQNLVTRERALLIETGSRATTFIQTDGGRFAARLLQASAADAEDGPEAAVPRLTQEATRSVLHFQRQNGLEAPERVLLGLAPQPPALAAALEAKLKVPVARLDVAACVDFPPGVTAPRSASSLALLAGAAELGLRGTGASLNLLPPSARRRQAFRRRQPWLLAAAALLAVALLPPILHYRQVGAAARAKAAAIEEAMAPLRLRDARNKVRLEELAATQREIAALQSVVDRRGGWIQLLADLQDRFTKVEDVWLESLQTVPPAGDGPMKLVVSGRMLDKTNPLAKVSPETFQRVQTLLAGLGGSPFIARVEGERFDNSRPGILKFDFVLVTNPAHPL